MPRYDSLFPALPVRVKPQRTQPHPDSLFPVLFLFKSQTIPAHQTCHNAPKPHPNALLPDRSNDGRHPIVRLGGVM